MKKYYYFIISLIAVCISSCSDDDVLLVPSEGELNTIQSSHVRTMDEVISIAQDAPRNFKNRETRAIAASNDVAIDNIQVVTSNPKTRSVTGCDTLLYVVNYSDNQGYAIVSANTETEGLLAYISEGSYNPLDSRIANSGISLFIDLAKKYVSSAFSRIDRPILYKRAEQKTELDTIITVKNPKLVVNWDQEGCYGYYAPNGTSGCAITAMAQVMTYYEHPYGMLITFPNAPESYHYFNWGNIKACNDTTTSNWNYSDARHEIALLNRELGHRAHSDYKFNYNRTTSTQLDSVQYVLQGLGYTVSFNNDNPSNSNRIFNALHDNKLVIMSGIDSSGLGGHAWVIDGYRKLTINYRYYTKYYDEDFWTLVESGSRALLYYHYNWGYSGEGNGYFLNNVFRINDTNAIYDNSPQHDYPQNYNSSIQYLIVSH